MKTIWTGTNGSLLGGRASEQLRLSFRKFVQDGDFPFKFDSGSPRTQLVHAGALVGVGVCSENPDLAWELNVKWARTLLQRAARAGVSRFFLVSTSHVYASSPAPLPEDSELGPMSLYAETKLKSEEACAQEAREMGIEFSALRVFSVVGSAVSPNPGSFSGLLARVVKGSREPIRFAADVRDVLTPSQYNRLLDLIIYKDDVPAVLNLASGCGLTLEQIASMYAASRGFDPQYLELQKENSEVPTLVADVQLLQATTGASPERLSFDQTLSANP